MILITEELRVQRQQQQHDSTLGVLIYDAYNPSDRTRRTQHTTWRVRLLKLRDDMKITLKFISLSWQNLHSHTHTHMERARQRASSCMSLTIWAGDIIPSQGVSRRTTERMRNIQSRADAKLFSASFFKHFTDCLCACMCLCATPFPTLDCVLPWHLSILCLPI